MSFFDDKPLAPSTDFPAYSSRLLFDTLQAIAPRNKHNHTAINKQLAAHAKRFELERLESLILWFSKHHSDDYVPKVRTIRNFHDKLPALFSAMARDKITKLDEYGNEVMDRLALYVPVMADHPELVHSVQFSLNYLYSLRAKILQQGTADSKRFCRAIVPDVVETVVVWFREHLEKDRIPPPLDDNNLKWQWACRQAARVVGMSSDWELPSVH